MRPSRALLSALPAATGGAAAPATTSAARADLARRGAASELGREPASPHAYTYREGATPFWRKFREMFSVNPDISSGLPLPTENRMPTPGSRPERQATMPTRASDIAGLQYYERDFRRAYPQLHMVTQKDLTTLLLADTNEDGTKSLPASGTSTALTRPSDLSSASAFTDVLAQAHAPSAEGAYAPSRLPPTPPFTRPTAILKKNPGDVPHDPHAYYPAENYH